MSCVRRVALLAWTQTVTDEALEQSGRHASGNILSAVQYLKIMAIHERDHGKDRQPMCRRRWRIWTWAGREEARWGGPR